MHGWRPHPRERPLQLLRCVLTRQKNPMGCASRMRLLPRVAYDEQSVFQCLQGFMSQMLIQTLDGEEVDVCVKLVGKQVVLA